MTQNLIGRAKRLIMSPKAEWDAIDGETVEPNDLIMNYVAPLAAIPAVASVVGLSIIGVNLFGDSFRAPIGPTLLSAIVSFAFAIIGVFVFAFIINALAPTFGAEKNYRQAFKVSAYAPTASWLAGVFAMIPMLAVLGLAGAIYSLYLLFIGLPKMMKPPAEKATAYTIVSIVVAIVAALLLSMVAAIFTPKPGVAALGGARADSVNRDLDERMARLEQAAESGDVNEIIGALGGDGDASIVDADALRELAPARLAGLERQSVNIESLAMPFKAVVMTASYGDADTSLDLSVTNSPMVSAMLGVAGFAGAEYDRRTDDGYERLKREGDSIVVAEWSQSSRNGRYGRTLAGSFLVEAKGRNIDIKDIERAAKEITEQDLKKLPRRL